MITTVLLFCRILVVVSIKLSSLTVYMLKTGIRRPTSFDINSSNHRVYVLLEFQEIIPLEAVDNNADPKLKFKKLSNWAKPPVRVT